jgi:hypothetical protein
MSNVILKYYHNNIKIQIINFYHGSGSNLLLIVDFAGSVFSFFQIFLKFVKMIL